MDDARSRWVEREGAGMSVRAPAHSAAPKPAPASRLRHVLQVGRAARRRCLDTGPPLDPDSSLLVAQLALNPEMVVGVSVVPFLASLDDYLPKPGHVTAFRVEVNIDLQTVPGRGVAGVTSKSPYETEKERAKIMRSKENAYNAVYVFAMDLSEAIKEDVMREIEKNELGFQPSDHLGWLTTKYDTLQLNEDDDDYRAYLDYYDDEDKKSERLPPYSGSWDNVPSSSKKNGWKDDDNIVTWRWDIAIQTTPFCYVTREWSTHRPPTATWSLPREDADNIAEAVLKGVTVERVSTIYTAGVLGRARPYKETAGPLTSKDWWVNRRPFMDWKKTTQKSPEETSSGSPFKYTVVLGARLGGFRNVEWLQRWLQEEQAFEKPPDGNRGGPRRRL